MWISVANLKFLSQMRKDTTPLRKVGQPTPVFLPGEPHGQRSLAGYSPWGHKDSDMTEAPERQACITLLSQNFSGKALFSVEAVRNEVLLREEPSGEAGAGVRNIRC